MKRADAIIMLPTELTTRWNMVDKWSNASIQIQREILDNNYLYSLWFTVGGKHSHFYARFHFIWISMTLNTLPMNMRIFHQIFQINNKKMRILAVDINNIHRTSVFYGEFPLT